MIPTSTASELVVTLTEPSLEDEAGWRQSRAAARLTFHAPDGAEIVGEPFVLKAPLRPSEIEDLGRYLEVWGLWPSEHLEGLAEALEGRMIEWGRRLEACLDVAAGRRPMAAWRRALAHGGPCRLTLEIGDSSRDPATAAAAARLLTLPWELIHDGSSPWLLRDGGVHVRRRRADRRAEALRTPELPIRVLMVSPRPSDLGDFDHRISARPVVEAIRPLAGQVVLELLESPSFSALRQRLESATEAGQPYHILHFDGHGGVDRDGLGCLAFERLGLSEEISGSELGALLARHHIPVVFLEACQSATAIHRPDASVAMQLLASGVDSVIAMTHRVLVETSRRFVTAFYPALMAGGSVAVATLAGQQALAADRRRGWIFDRERQLSDWFVPVLYQQGDVSWRVEDLRSRPELVPSAETSAESFLDEPRHGFLGRSRELRSLEQRLSRDRYAVVTGEGGEGKTALACELARWLLATRRTNRILFVSLESHREPRAVIEALGTQLSSEFVVTLAQDPEKALRSVEQRLIEDPTVVVIDNCESLLPTGPGSSLDRFTALDDSGVRTFELLDRLVRVGATRLIFTSRIALPPPFSEHALELDRLSRESAKELVARVLTANRQRPAHEVGEGNPEAAIEDLIQTVGCHARSLVLLAAEIAIRGARATSAEIRASMQSLAARYPDERERSLFASVELSLRRLPTDFRSRLGPLAAFHGGASLLPLATALGLSRLEAADLMQRLERVGLARKLRFGYFSIHPALAPWLATSLDEEALQTARRGWLEGMARLVAELHFSPYADLTARLARYELPNLLAFLETLPQAPDRGEALEAIHRLEVLLAPLGNARVLDQVVQIRHLLGAGPTISNHGRFIVETAAVQRLLDAGALEEAIEQARRLASVVDEVEESVSVTPYDQAMVLSLLGRALAYAGQCRKALAPLERSQRIFESLGASEGRSAERMAVVCRIEVAECLLELGRLEEASDAIGEAIDRAASLGEERDLAVAEGVLADVRLAQGRRGGRNARRRLEEALRLSHRLRDVFMALDEPKPTGGVLSTLGACFLALDRADDAERAFQQALTFFVQAGFRRGEIDVLRKLGQLFGDSGRFEEAASIFRRAAELAQTSSDPSQRGVLRYSLALMLRRLGRFEEARREILQAIACDELCDASVEPWKSHHLHAQIEQDLGDDLAATKARHHAIRAYRAFRIDGGEGGPIFQRVAQDLNQGALGTVRQGLGLLRRELERTPEHDALLFALDQVAAGARDPAIADDPWLHFTDAVDLRLMLENDLYG